MKNTKKAIYMAMPLLCLNLTTFAMDITLKNGDITVKKAMEILKQESGYSFVFSTMDVDVNKKISVWAENKNIEDVVGLILSGQNLTYELDGKNIILKKATKISNNRMSPVADKKITGVVLDENNEPVIGANIVVKGDNTNGTITDIDGKFTLTVPTNATLQISYIGYKTQTLPIDQNNNYTIKLTSISEQLEEVVVVGYGTQRKGNIATSVSTVKADQLKNRPVQTLAEALQGQVPGLSIVGKAAPGQSPSIQLRGHSSLNGGGAPLVLVDGVPSDFNYLNPEDIESINVLKDAASSAIYGSRGANGVLLVTTKRGRQGKPIFNYNGSFGINTPASAPESVTSAQYARIKNEAETNMGRKAPYSDEEILLYENGTDPNRHPNTNWIKHILTNRITTRHAIDASGGTDKVKYLVSAGMDYQTGVIPETSQNVFNVRSNTDINVSKKLDLSFDLRYQLRELDEVSNIEDICKQFLFADPTMVDYYTDGSYGYNSGFFPNPLVPLYEGGRSSYNRHEASGIFKIDYTIIKDLKFTGIANVKYVHKNATSKSRTLKYKDFFTEEIFEKGDNSFSDRRDQNVYYNLQALLTYKKKFGNHNFDILGGYQQENEQSNWLSGARSGYPTDLIWQIDGGPKDNWTNGGNASHWALASILGRVNYDYDNKYIASFSVRTDASSRFTKDNRWATFPSVALAWRLSQESFMEATRGFIDDLKLRGTWGQTGIATGLGLYPSYTTIGMSGVVINNEYKQTAALKSIGNTELSWERSEMINVAIDGILFDNRLNFTAEYYDKETKDILLQMPVPLEYGFGKQLVNTGKMRNRGWEFSIGWNDRISDFGYRVSVNLSNNKNKVLDLGDTGPWKSGTTYTDLGLPFNSIYGYEALGLFQSDDEVKNAPFQNSKTGAGDVKYKDQNNDNKIDANDRIVIGDPYAHYLYGINLNFDYKGFDLGMLFQGVGQQDRIIKDNMVRPFFDSSIYKHNLDYWSETNKDAKYPRILNKDDGTHNYEQSNYWMVNAGYLRMKNLTLGYTIPKHFLRPSGFERIRLYFTANNLFTISDFVPGLDPEASSSVAYPFSRTYSFGVNVQF